MAWAVNGALGTKMAFPDRPIIVACGDGCYLLSGFELLTAVRYKLPVIWIIFQDDEYKLIKLYQIDAFHETGLVDFPNPDYVAYAKACGARGFQVNSLNEFEAAFPVRARLRSADADRRPDQPTRYSPLQPEPRRSSGCD
jgi:acetolactate synthase-1/2/3 large subunit